MACRRRDPRARRRQALRARRSVGTLAAERSTSGARRAVLRPAAASPTSRRGRGVLGAARRQLRDPRTARWWGSSAATGRARARCSRSSRASRRRPRGAIVLRGRVGTLLEVGTGFHPELTGRENIFLNGAILGMKRREIMRKFDEIVEFAGVERVPRHAGQALLQRHVRAAGVRRGRAPRAGDPARRRGAGGRRRRVPAQVPRQDARRRRRGPDGPLRQPQPRRRAAAVQPRPAARRGQARAGRPTRRSDRRLPERHMPDSRGSASDRARGRAADGHRRGSSASRSGWSAT